MLLADKSSVPSGHDTSTTDICTLVGIIHLIGGIFLRIIRCLISDDHCIVNFVAVLL